jgi:hypothetical protein
MKKELTNVQAELQTTKKNRTMKNFFLALTLTAAFVMQAQKTTSETIPAVVKTKFASLFPNAKVEKWEKEGANYEAEFHEGKVETSAVFDGKGNHLFTEVEIPVKALPQGANAYLLKMGLTAKEAAKMTDSKGIVTYEAEAGGEDYIFDASGNFVRKETEKDAVDDDKK